MRPKDARNPMAEGTLVLDGLVDGLGRTHECVQDDFTLLDFSGKNRDRVVEADLRFSGKNRVEVPMLGVTVYPSLFRVAGWTHSFESVQESVQNFLSLLTTHTAIVHKQDAPGFGPYLLHTPTEPCLRHGLVPMTEPHRCDACVRELTLAVFDVDVGTVEEIEACEDLLVGDGVLHAFYSTFSYRPEAERPSLRLVVGLNKPIPADLWKAWRAAFIHRFAVPAALDKCSAPSHFYYAPSIPVGATWEPVAVVHPGRLFPVDSLPVTRRHSFVSPNPKTTDLDTSPMPAEKLEEWRRLLEKKVRRLSRGTATDRDKGEILRRLLAGEPLAEHGSRNQTSTRAAALVLAGWHEGTLGGAMQLFAPSLEAMRAEGSKLDAGTVFRQLSSAFVKVEASRARRAELDAQLEALLLGQ